MPRRVKGQPRRREDTQAVAPMEGGHDIELHRCWTCYSSNPTLKGEPAPTRCGSCGQETVAFVYKGKGDFWLGLTENHYSSNS